MCVCMLLPSLLDAVWALLALTRTFHFVAVIGRVQMWLGVLSVWTLSTRAPLQVVCCLAILDAVWAR